MSVHQSVLLMAEIRRSPVEVGRLSHYLQDFIHPRGPRWLAGFLPSTVWFWTNYIDATVVQDRYLFQISRHVPRKHDYVQHFIATSSRRLVTKKMVVIVRESPPKSPKLFRNYSHFVEMWWNGWSPTVAEAMHLFAPHSFVRRFSVTFFDRSSRKATSQRPTLAASGGFFGPKIAKSKWSARIYIYIYIYVDTHIYRFFFPRNTQTNNPNIDN